MTRTPWHLLYALAGAAALAAFPSISQAACEPITGIEELHGAQAPRIIVIGDYHGTRQIPEFFADVVCNLAEGGRRVAVGLEWPQSAEPLLRAFLDSPTTANRAALIRGLSAAGRDGRASEAMLSMIDRLRREAPVALQNAVLFQPAPGLSGSAYEERMATLLMDGYRQHAPDAMIVLVGNVHAMREPLPSAADLKPMASFLPLDQTLTFNVVGYFGSAWSCRQSEGPGGLSCRSWPLQDGDPGPRRVYRTSETRFDGRYSVGVPFTASEPANGDAFDDSRLHDNEIPLGQPPAQHPIQLPTIPEVQPKPETRPQ